MLPQPQALGFLWGRGRGEWQNIGSPPLEIPQINNTNWGVKNFFLRHECIQKKIIPYLREIGEKKFCQTFFILFGNPKMVILSK